MPDHQAVRDHYASGDLLETIKAAFAVVGKTPGDITIDDLGLIDEFHIGGRQASEEFLSQLSLAPPATVLDIGCGIGGPARFTADRFGVRVTGLDLTDEFVETGKALTGWLGMEDCVELLQASALDMPFDDHAFDAAYMLHVGMNIADKDGLVAQTARVLKPGAIFGVYDVMRAGPGELQFPVPWASKAEISTVDEPERYKLALEAHGFEIIGERLRRDFALEFFAKQRAKVAAQGGPGPLGPHIVMGPTMAEKIGNLVANIKAGALAPVELIARKK